MQQDLSVQVEIGGKLYNLKVKLEDIDEVRKAEQEINDKINLLKQGYKVKDSSDLLAMTLLQLLVEKNQTISLKDSKKEDEEMYQKLSDLESFVSNYIKSK